MKKRKQRSSYKNGIVKLSRSRWGILNIKSKDFNNVQSALTARSITISAITTYSVKKKDGSFEDRLRLHYEPSSVKPFKVSG